MSHALQTQPMEAPIAITTQMLEEDKSCLLAFQCEVGQAPLLFFYRDHDRSLTAVKNELPHISDLGFNFALSFMPVKYADFIQPYPNIKVEGFYFGDFLIHDNCQKAREWDLSQQKHVQRKHTHGEIWWRTFFPRILEKLEKPDTSISTIDIVYPNNNIKKTNSFTHPRLDGILLAITERFCLFPITPIPVVFYKEMTQFLRNLSLLCHLHPMFKQRYFLEIFMTSFLETYWKDREEIEKVKQKKKKILSYLPHIPKVVSQQCSIYETRPTPLSRNIKSGCVALEKYPQMAYFFDTYPDAGTQLNSCFSAVSYYGPTYE
jgi:hypothetical protein